MAFIGTAFIIASPVEFLRALIARRTTELAITTDRVIAKFGLIKRKTAELNINRFESLSVDQSILGRMLNYGTIAVSGTGGGITPVPGIDDPLEFRRNVFARTNKDTNA